MTPLKIIWTTKKIVEELENQAERIRSARKLGTKEDMIRERVEFENQQNEEWIPAEHADKIADANFDGGYKKGFDFATEEGRKKVQEFKERIFFIVNNWIFLEKEDRDIFKNHIQKIFSEVNVK